MSRIFSRSTGSSSPTRRSGPGSRSSERSSCDGPGPADSGILTRSSSRSTASDTSCGGRSTRTATCWTSSCRRAAAAARRFMRKLFKRWGLPRVMVTDKLGSYPAAKAKLAPGVAHRRHKGINNAAEASHRHTPPTREDHGSVQLAATRPAVPVGPRSDSRHLPPAVTAFPPVPTATQDRMRSTSGPPTPPNCPRERSRAAACPSEQNNLTMPVDVAGASVWHPSPSLRRRLGSSPCRHGRRTKPHPCS